MLTVDKLIFLYLIVTERFSLQYLYRMKCSTKFMTIIKLIFTDVMFDHLEQTAKNVTNYSNDQAVS